MFQLNERHRRVRSIGNPHVIISWTKVHHAYCESKSNYVHTVNVLCILINKLCTFSMDNRLTESI